MKKCMRLLILVLAVGMAPVVSGMEATQEVPDTVKMESAVYKSHKKPIVVFTHKKHAQDYGIACTDCHHVYKDGKNTWQEGDAVERCDSCHSKDKPSPEERKAMSEAEKMAAFHYEAIHENCKACHKDLKKAGKPTGPISCTKCHVK